MEVSKSVREIFRVTSELERRRAPRNPPDADVYCLIRDPRSGSWRPGGIRDISATGIALLTNAFFETERLLTIELRDSKRGIARKYLVEVRHSDICCPNDTWLHGCRFIHPLSDDDLQLWI
jgi:hypothetical protein